MKLRSQQWFGREGRDGFLYRSWIKNQGWPHDLFDGRPVIGICNTWSELTPCNAHFREIAEFVKRGVWEAGGFPLEFPVMSLGEMMIEEYYEAESCMHRSKGHCMTMGTASTMANMVEALGMSLPGNAAIPAVDARRNTLAQLTGRRIVQMVGEDFRISKILTREAFENAIRANAAVGGSTNAVIHLIAIAGRIGVPLCLDDFERLGSELPWLVNLQPSGKYLMEDYFYAGGLPAVLREMGQAGALNRNALTANGKTIWENVVDAPCWNRDVIHTFNAPFKANAGITVLRGNLAPDGAIIKLSAASPHLLQHRGRAVV